jgi:hypothetical protein
VVLNFGLHGTVQLTHHSKLGELGRQPSTQLTEHQVSMLKWENSCAKYNPACNDKSLE